MKGPLNIDLDLKRPGTGDVPYVRPRGSGGFVPRPGDLDSPPELHHHPEVRAIRKAESRKRNGERVLRMEPSGDTEVIQQQLDAFALVIAWYASAAELAAAFIREVLNLEPETVPGVWMRYAVEAQAVAKQRGEVLVLGALPVLQAT